MAIRTAYEVVMPYHLHMPSYFLGTFTEYPYIKPSYGDGKKNLFAMKPIGELIKERLKAEERSVAWFARKLSCSRANVYKIFCKEYIDTELLTRISRILNYDFFQYFSEHLKEK